MFQAATKSCTNCLSANGPPNAIRFTKMMLNHWYKQMAPAFEASLAVEMLGFAGSESREGLASFREKRDPKWDPAKCDI